MSHMVVEEFVSPRVNQKDKLHDTRNGGGGSRCCVYAATVMMITNLVAASIMIWSEGDKA